MFTTSKMDHLAIFISIFIFVTVCCSCQNENSCETLNRKCFRAVALIPARAGSKGIKNKNLSIIGNETFIARALRIVHDSGRFESIWVSTDGEEIANEATSQGAKVHWRDPLTATDNASTVSAVKDFLERQNGTDFDIIAVVQCTSPFLTEKFLNDALDIMLDTNADCVFSVTRSFQLRWTENDSGYVSPLNFNPQKRPRRQDWNGELVENGMFYFVKPKLVLQKAILQNSACKVIEIPKYFSLEIDNPMDLIVAQRLLPLLINYQ